MEVIFDKSFLKAIDKLTDKALKKKIEKIIIELEESDSLLKAKNIKKMEGFKSFYRIRVGDFRIGFELEKFTTIRLITIVHRKDIYKIFP
jgi:mRNA interferase RelE/StbE